MLGKYANNKEVLNLFSYTGGFSLHALVNGANHVTSIDISSKAMDLLQENLKANSVDLSKHESINRRCNGVHHNCTD